MSPLELCRGLLPKPHLRYRSGEVKKSKGDSERRFGRRVTTPRTRAKTRREARRSLVPGPTLRHRSTEEERKRANAKHALPKAPTEAKESVPKHLKAKERKEQKRRMFKRCQICATSRKWSYLELRLELEDP